jgi:hypothetical protein
MQVTRLVIGMHRVRFLNRYLLALLVFNLAACSTLQTVSIESAMRQSPPPGVDYGSLVVVKTLAGETAKFRVTAINADGLGGQRGFYRYEDMATLRVEDRRGADGQVTTILLGLLGVAALVFLVANADSVSVCSSAPCEQP